MVVPHYIHKMECLTTSNQCLKFLSQRSETIVPVASMRVGSAYVVKTKRYPPLNNIIGIKERLPLVSNIRIGNKDKFNELMG